MMFRQEKLRRIPLISQHSVNKRKFRVTASNVQKIFIRQKNFGTFVESIFKEGKKYPHKVQEALQLGTNLNLLQDKYIFT